VAEELVGLADALLAHAAALRRQYDELASVLAEARPPVAEAGDPARPMARMPPGRTGEEAREDAPRWLPARPAPARPARHHGAGDEGAMLVALDMALNGTPREEAAAYLRETFGIERTDILDEPPGRSARPRRTSTPGLAS
jgi:hypothetical protein